jgi:hypothetical protein
MTEAGIQVQARSLPGDRNRRHNRHREHDPGQRGNQGRARILSRVRALGHGYDRDWAQDQVGNRARVRPGRAHARGATQSQG